MTLDLLIEGVVAVLLAVTIGYAFVLNRRLTALRAEQDNLGRLISGLNQATARAQEGVYELRSVAQASEESLKREISRARALTDELALISEAGNNLAEKIEKGLAEQRRAATASAPVKLRVREEQQPAERKNVARLWDLEEQSHDEIRTALRAAR